MSKEDNLKASRNLVLHKYHSIEFSNNHSFRKSFTKSIELTVFEPNMRLDIAICQK